MRNDITKVAPAFANPQSQPAVLKELAAYAKSMGFSDQEVANIRDRRVLLMVYKAMKLDQIHAMMGQ